MKIHILPTDKPSRIIFDNEDNTHLPLQDEPVLMERQDWVENQHLYITSDEEITGFENNIWVIKGDRIFLWQNTMALVSNNKPKKIILTTDSDLIADGVQPIVDDFLQWFVKNPTCESVEIEEYNPTIFYRDKPYRNFKYKIIIPSEEVMKRPNQYSKPLAGVRTENYHPQDLSINNQYANDLNAYIDYLEMQQKISYSAEEVFNMCRAFATFVMRKGPSYKKQQEWFEQNKKK